MVDAAIGQLGPVLAGSSTRFTVSSRMHSTRDAVSQEEPRGVGEDSWLGWGPGPIAHFSMKSNSFLPRIHNRKIHIA